MRPSALTVSVAAIPSCCCLRSFSFPPSSHNTSVHILSSHHHFEQSSLHLSSIFTCSTSLEPLRVRARQPPLNTTNSQHTKQLLFKPSDYPSSPSPVPCSCKHIIRSCFTGHKPRYCHQDWHLDLQLDISARESAILILVSPSAKAQSLNHSHHHHLNMSGKLDQSLDEILSTRRKTAGRRGRAGRRVGNGTKVATATPAGGIQKNTRSAKTAPEKGAVPSGPAAGGGESKIIVSNLVRLLVEPNMLQ